MGKGIYKLILIVIVASSTYIARAADDDDDKKLIKKLNTARVDGKTQDKTSKTKNDDTLVYDKKALDDTLTFDDKHSTDDTLIFADDEMRMKGSPNNENKETNKNEFSLVNSQSAAAFNTLIYPNPSFGNSHIETNAADNSSTEITITSQEGTLIRHITTTAKSYDINDLAAGTYLVTIKNGTNVVQKRLFVK